LDSRQDILSTMNRQKILRFGKCSVLNRINDVSARGFDRNHTEEEMIRIAIQNWCPIIVKNGKSGKWYLRGRGRSTEFLQSKIDEEVGNHRDGVYCLWLPDELLEFGVTIDGVSPCSFS